MSLVLWLVSAFICGLLLSPLLILSLAPVFDGAAKFLTRTGIRAGDDWVLVPVGGTKYTLEMVDYDDAEGKAWRSGDDDDEDREYYDDHGGRMRTLWGKSFGIAVDDISAIVDPVDCAVGAKEAEKATDGGTTTADATFSIEELANRAHVGRIERQTENLIQRIEYINPFVLLDEQENSQQIVDVRDAVTVLAQNGSPDTPRKTAENAAQAERAFEDWGELKRNASLIAAFFMGGIVATFLGGGGGGGGGSVSSPIMIEMGRSLAQLSAMLLGVA